MLLLVPSQKTEDNGTRNGSTSHNRVLVVLPSDTDLSSNVIVPDTAITTTLGTNDTLDTIYDFAISPFSTYKRDFIDSPRNTRDHLGIMQLSRPAHRPIQQPNIHQSSEFPPEDQFSRSRRHSHTGHVETRYSRPFSFTQPRSRSRQSLSQSSPYHTQPVRTPRALRSAFRKARKDQSPLLTSASFGSDYALPSMAIDSMDDNVGFPSKPCSGHNSLSLKTGYSEGSGDHLPMADGRASSVGAIQSGLCRAHSANALTVAQDKMDQDPDVNLELNEQPRTGPDCAWRLIRSIAHPESANAASSKRHARESSEISDVGEMSDEESSASKDSESAGKVVSCVISKSTGTMDHPTQGNGIVMEGDAELQSTIDADMTMILGMASDMELVMPTFDDDYLQDLNDDSAPTRSSRSCSASAASSAESHSSSTTAAWLSTQCSLRSHSSTPCAVSVEVGQRADSVPTSPGILKARERAHSPIVCQQVLDSSPLQSSSNQSVAQEDASAIGSHINSSRHCHDNLRHNSDTSNMDRASARSSTSSPSSRGSSVVEQPSLSFSSSVSSSSSSSLVTTASEERKSKGPIYFKPTHHILPEQRVPGEHPQQNLMVIHSGQWTSDNRDPAGSRPYQSQFRPGSSFVPGSGGNPIFRIQEPSPVSPPSVLDKGAMMTANNISMITANMSVLTPQEVQEDYYARRTLRMQQQQQQRQRRRSAAVGSSSVGGLGFRTEGISSLCQRRFSASDIQPFEKPVVPAIGASPLPASYYIPPSAFRTEAAVAAEQEAERKRKEEEEELKESFLVFPSPTLS
ncbi:hypothetical protein BC939DRAFT_463218 [Gamsiella multidivaricata]|uniref:uncharacterized protein n=1 Tax=Gamsiella multidivaricata TaxID=101098 RepID=UPI0022201D31|nr:uncharacterized protein BC939DRAFT_463218 [Gamsiella multidivaricata]KAI7818422.1 hypothetical protein BC939DRAFT_463218 [Gamsiella multidivaricata]